MLWVFVAMAVIIGLAALVAAYVAFPHRGEDIPAAAWLGEAMQKGVDRLPTIDNLAAGEDSDELSVGSTEQSPGVHRA